MRNKRAEISELKTRLLLAGITVVAMIVVSGINHGDEARGAGLRSGSKMLVSSEPNSTLQTQKPSGASERVVELSARDASWSPDGKQLVFAQGSALYVANGLGSEARLLYSGVGLLSAPRFSAHGDRIQFTVKDVRRNTRSFWEVLRNGSDAHLVRGE
jgi:Tol biopolymer transport system component